jgi:uncharacterized protein (TIGR03437 family)
MRFVALCLALPISAANYNISTLAGSDWVGENVAATSAILLQAEGIVADNFGNIYISDANTHRLRVIAPNGIIRTIAGNGIAGFSGDNGPASSAQFNAPYGLAFDFAGNLYIADLANARIRRISPAGIITTIAGGGALPAGGNNDGSIATAVYLNSPRNIAIDGSGILYISDFGAHRVYKMTTDGTLTTIAGTGAAGYSGDGAAAFNQLNFPTALAVDRLGNLYIADSGNHLIRQVSAGRMTSIARATLPTGLAFDGVATLYVADHSAGQILAIALSSGTATAMNVSAADIAYSNDGTLYAADFTVARRVTLSGFSTVIAGGGNLAEGDGAAANQARLNHPGGIALDGIGNLYIADHDNNRIRRVGLNGSITTYAGLGTAGNTGDGGSATLAMLNGPSAVRFDAFGNLYIADTGNARIRMVTPGGIILPVTTGPLSAPVNIIFDKAQNLYIADAAAIFKVSNAGVTSTVFGGFKSPRGMVFDANGNFYFSETGAKQVWMFAPSGAHSLIAPGVWSSPQGLAIDASGNLLVADSGLEQVLSVDPFGQVTPVAGTGSAGFAGDGGSSLLAQLNAPVDIAVNGSLYISDTANNRIRQLVSSGSQITVAPIMIVSAVNAASMAPGPIAPGMLMALLGINDVPDTQVLFNGVAVPNLSVTQVLVRAPVTLAGSVQITVTSKGAQIAQIMANVVDAAPALFANAVNQDGSLNSPSNPAARGSVITLFGTGEGIQNLPFTVSIGGYDSTILYAGPAGSYAGMFQTNVQVPSGYFAGGTLPVLVTVGSFSTQAGITVSLF